MHVKKNQKAYLLKKPDIRYPVTSGYLAGYPNPDFQNPDIRVSGFIISIRYNPSEYRKNQPLAPSIGDPRPDCIRALVTFLARPNSF